MENVLNLIWKGGKNDDGNNVGANRLVTTLLHAFPLLFKSMCYNKLCYLFSIQWMNNKAFDSKEEREYKNDHSKKYFRCLMYNV